MQEITASLFKLAQRAILELLQSKQAALTAAVQKSILNRMGLMQQMGYTMMGGDEIVERIVERVLQQKLPIFLSVKSKELQQVFMVAGSSVCSLPYCRFRCNSSRWKAWAQQLLEQPAVHQAAGRMAGASWQPFVWICRCGSGQAGWRCSRCWSGRSCSWVFSGR